MPTRKTAWQSGPKCCRPTRLEVFIGLTAERVKPTSRNVGLELAVPLIGLVVLEPLGEPGEFVGLQLGDSGFEFLHAHGWL